VFDHLPISLTVQDQNGRFILADWTAATNLGIASEALIGPRRPISLCRPRPRSADNGSLSLSAQVARRGPRRKSRPSQGGQRPRLHALAYRCSGGKQRRSTPDARAHLHSRAPAQPKRAAGDRIARPCAGHVDRRGRRRDLRGARLSAGLNTHPPRARVLFREAILS
jgi:hypothetical protein